MYGIWDGGSPGKRETWLRQYRKTPQAAIAGTSPALLSHTPRAAAAPCDVAYFLGSRLSGRRLGESHFSSPDCEHRLWRLWRRSRHRKGARGSEAAAEINTIRGTIPGRDKSTCQAPALRHRV